jgi:hypothetical protein
VDRVAPPRGYILSDRQHVEELFAVEAELLRSEGIDPEWPGFPEAKQDSQRNASS